MNKVTFALLVMVIFVVLLLPSRLTADETEEGGRDPLVAADGSPIVYENGQVKDAVESFYGLSKRGEWLGFELGMKQPSDEYEQLELFPKPFANHIQGMARSPRVGQAPVFYFSVSGTPEDEDSYAALLVVQMGSLPYHGERLGSNRLQKGVETTSTSPDPGLRRDRVVKIIPYPYQNHPSGIAMVGDILAVPNGAATAENDDSEEIRIMFYDCSDPLNPVELPDNELTIKADWEVPELFYVGDIYADDLENIVDNIVSEDLRYRFSVEGFTLSENATIHRNQKNVWHVKDDTREFSIHREVREDTFDILWVYDAEVSPPWSHGGQGVAITKLPPHGDYPDGRFLLVTNTSQGAHFHWSNQGTFDENLRWTDYQELLYERVWNYTLPPPHHLPDLVDLSAAGYWPDSKPLFQNITFVDQANGTKFLIGARNTEQFSPVISMFGNDELYMVKLTNPQSPGRLTLSGAARDYNKELRSPGKKRYHIVQEWEERYYYFTEYLRDIPDLPWYFDFGITLAKPISKRTQANFNAGATAYVSPSGELIYYGVHHWADGSPGPDVNTVDDEHYNKYVEGDFVKLAELSHSTMTVDINCGSLKPRENHLGGPYTVRNPWLGAKLYGEVYSIKPWVRMYEEDDWAGHMVTVDYDTQNEDDYDYFKYLDGAFNECRDRYEDDPRGGWDGFSNCMSSYQWCGPSGSTLTFFDNAERKPCTKSSCEDDYVRYGRDWLDMHTFRDKDFKEEADSVLIEWTPPVETYAWDLIEGDGSFVEDEENPFLTKYYPSINSTTDTVQLTYTRESAGYTYTTDVTSGPMDPGFVYLMLDDDTPETGQLVTLDGAWNFSTAISTTVSVDWGDGIVNEVISLHESGHTAPYRGLFNFSHSYATAGSHIIDVCAVSEEGIEICDDYDIYVSRSRLNLTAGKEMITDEGGFARLQGALFIDKDVNNGYVAKIDWGDGSGLTEGHITMHEGIGGMIDGIHYYADDGRYPVTVCVLDDSNVSRCGITVTTVYSVAPQDVVAGLDQAVDEGELVQLGPVTFTDPGYDCPSCNPATEENFSATIDWGDGTTEPAADINMSETTGGPTVSTTGSAQAGHYYADDGLYTVNVCIQDDDFEVGCDTFTVTVTNVAPTVAAGDDQVIYEGDTVKLDPAKFSDPGFDCPSCDPITEEDFTAAVDWGDGASEPAAEIRLFEYAGSEGVLTMGTVAAGHQYLAVPGIYTVTVCVTDDDEAESCDSFDVTVVHGFMRFCAYADDEKHGLTFHKEGVAACAESESGLAGEMRASGIGSRGKLHVEDDTVIDGLLLSLEGKLHVGQDANVSGILSTGHDVDVDKGSQIHDSISAGHRVTIKKDVVVDGDVTAVDKIRVDRRAEVTGAISPNSSVEPIPAITFVAFSFEPGSEKITVKADAPLHLVPGAYKDVKVKKGATLVLSGAYVFKEFEMEKDAILQIDLSGGPVVVDVAANLSFNENVQVQIVSTTDDASEILFRIAGKKVDLKKDGRYLGTFLAPTAEVKLDKDATLVGALYGKKVDIGEGAVVEGRPARDLFASNS